jgi:hypothetical protein
MAATYFTPAGDAGFTVVAGGYDDLVRSVNTLSPGGGRT